MKQLQFCLILSMAFVQIHAVSTYFRPGIFYQMQHGICPEGLQEAVAILASGCVAVPGIMGANALKNTYVDINSHLPTGLQYASAAAGAYAFLKVNSFLQQRTPQALFEQKRTVQKKIDDLSDTHARLNTQSVIKKLEIRYAQQGECGYLILMKNYLTQLINDSKWINQKLILLHEPIIDIWQIDILEKALAEIVKNSFFRQDSALYKNHKEIEYNNKLTTKAKRAAWWLTVNGIKKTAQASWFLTKLTASMCWSTFKITLQTTLHKI